jgi:hypothetical protein
MRPRWLRKENLQQFDGKCKFCLSTTVLVMLRTTYLFNFAKNQNFIIKRGKIKKKKIGDLKKKEKKRGKIYTLNCI